MSEALYLSMFTSCQTSGKDLRRRKHKALLERLGRFFIYGSTVTAFALNAADPTLYAGVSTAICLALECIR